MREVPLFQARASVALEYQVRSSENVWNLTVLREPLAAFVFDFFISNSARFYPSPSPLTPK